jgi:hypothetical protein
MRKIVAKDKSVHFDHRKKQFVNLSDEHFQLLGDTFPGIELDVELKKMSLWLLSKGTSYKGSVSFIMNWLGKAPRKSTATQIEIDNSVNSPLAPFLLAYLEPLWKRAENVLTLNTIHKTS